MTEFYVLSGNIARIRVVQPLISELNGHFATDAERQQLQRMHGELQAMWDRLSVRYDELREMLPEAE